MKNSTAAAALVALLAATPALAQTIDPLGELLKAITKPRSKGGTAGARDADVREPGGYMAPPELLALSSKENYGKLASTEIAGVRIGLRPAEVITALQKAGYEIGERQPAVSFADFVGYHSRTANNQSGPSLNMYGTNIIRATLPTQEVEVSFAQWPDGSRVREVRLEAPSNRIRPEDFAAGAIAKFGEADRTRQQTRLWCAAAEIDCSSEDSPHMRLKTSTFGGSLVLSAGSSFAIDQRLKKLEAAEIDRLTNRVKSIAF